MLKALEWWDAQEPFDLGDDGEDDLPEPESDERADENQEEKEERSDLEVEAHPVEAGGFGEEGTDDPHTIERAEGDEIEDEESEVDGDAEAEEEADETGGDFGVGLGEGAENDCEDHRLNEVRDRPADDRDEVIPAGVPHFAGVHGDGFAPAYPEAGEDGDDDEEAADRIEVLEEVEGDAPIDAGCRVSGHVGELGVGVLVYADGEEDDDQRGDDVFHGDLDEGFSGEHFVEGVAALNEGGGAVFSHDDGCGPCVPVVIARH